MNSKWELKEHSTGDLTVSVEGETWEKAQKKAFAKLAKNVQLPGFRKGKVPANVLKRAVNPQSVMYEAIDEIANDVFLEAVKEQNLEIVGKASLDIDDISEAKVTMKFTVAIKPEVKLGDYKNLDVKKEAVTITDDEVNAQIKQIQERNADFVIREDDEAIENGDTAVIDFEGSKDGVLFEGGSGTSYPLEIGSGSFIPGFEEQCIGMKKGETKEITVTFPENYQAAELAGQEAQFKVTVHEIKYKQLNDFDDEMVKEQNIEGVETVDAFKEYTLKNLTEQKEQQVDEAFTNELLTKIVDGAEIDIPQAMIDEECDGLVNDFAQRLKAQGFEMDTYLKLTNMSEEALREQFAIDAKNKVSARLVLEAIADAESIVISEDDINTEIETIAKTYNMESEQVKQLIPNESVSYDLKMRKALELVKETAGK